MNIEIGLRFYDKDRLKNLRDHTVLTWFTGRDYITIPVTALKKNTTFAFFIGLFDRYRPANTYLASKALRAANEMDKCTLKR